ncbi:GGDEF domain-containing protein [Allokutzneria sp. A3M-2-11 16]|uniref:GGDEF domain-containing protein n=1 Tax=Allokutzneria sp. A3M-2-11 16 TaxID=2962043 RepID=UPI0020B679D7|nr:GGDEF domain-containing protein [Allokutzneria sp. A3M-2-11 16]MCP3802716.1 GGDEF domain-containing protein [Allokutzneria sp. A3M-2-11 16]
MSAARGAQWRLFRAVAVVVSLVLVAASVMVTTEALGNPGSVLADKTLQVLFSVVTVVTLLVGARRRSGADRDWRLWMTATACCMGLGLGVWIWTKLISGLPLPASTLGNIAYFMVPVFALITVISLIDLGVAGEEQQQQATRPRRARAVLLLDVVIVASSVLLVGHAGLMLKLTNRSASSMAGGNLVLQLMHPISYVLVAVIAVLVSGARGLSRQPALGLLVLGFLAHAVSATITTSLVLSGIRHIPPVIDIGYMTGNALFLLTAVAPPGRPSSRKRRRSDHWLRLAVPYVPLPIAALFLAFRATDGTQIEPLEIYLGSCLIAAVVGRQLIAIADNLWLLGRLRASQRELEYQAYHDSLTGLANRALFQETLRRAVENNTATGPPLLVLFIDFDDFKKVNDQYGHATGDALLRVISARLRALLPSTDLVARLGGDEFGILLHQNGKTAEQVGTAVLEGMQRPYQVDGREHVVRASIGLAELSPDDATLTAEELLARADSAMYTAKRRGKGTLALHST